MPSHHGPTSPSSPSTLKRIPSSQLRPGMFLIRVLDSWWKSPFFTHRRLLKSPKEVQQLMFSGIREVEIDTALSVADEWLDESGVDDVGTVSEVGICPIESCEIEDSVRPEKVVVSCETELPPDNDLDTYSEELKNRDELIQLREATFAAVEGAFEGVKTGQQISHPVVQEIAQGLVRSILATPVLMAEIVLIDSLKQCMKSLYAHVVDTAVYSILVGLKLGWDAEVLERVGIAGLLHDVGYMRLPQNVVKAHWEGRDDSVLLQKHVLMGEALIKRQSQFPEDILRMVREHHAYQDGSGYPEGQGGALLSESGQLLGIVDYFDELITVGGPAGSLPAALAIRRLYQEAKKGKFSTRYIEAMIRLFGVFPVGTVVQLSSGEQAVVTKQQSEGGIKPQVKIFRTPEGTLLDEPHPCDLSFLANADSDLGVVRVLEPSEYSLDLEEFVLT